MEHNIKFAIEEYQCPGCAVGYDLSCFEGMPFEGIGCSRHQPATRLSNAGLFFTGMPVGFNRLGVFENMNITIFKKYEDTVYDKLNIPVWKHLNKNNHTIVRGIKPRKNEPFLHIFLENCLYKIDCLEITSKDIEQMD